MLSKVTEKYQITLPKRVREKVGLKPGEIVSVEVKSEKEIIIRRFPTVKRPSDFIVGSAPAFERPISVEELEKRIEER